MVESSDDEVLKGLSTRLFTVEQLSLQKAESEESRDLLIILILVSYRAALPSRNTLRD
jgi:hypothetical protein